MTNREFYQAIGELEDRFASASRSLETYLLALLGLARATGDAVMSAPLPPETVLRLLTEAFTAGPVAFDPAWRDAYPALDPDAPGFAGWEARLIRQVVDLREMDEAGTLENPHRYFGVKSPRGQYWYNFDPTGYLECAIAGSVGGWEPDDDTGRVLVPGEVALMDAEGNVRSVPSSEVERPVFDLPPLTWEQFQDFLLCGQIYE